MSSLRVFALGKLLTSYNSSGTAESDTEHCDGRNEGNAGRRRRLTGKLGRKRTVVTNDNESTATSSRDLQSASAGKYRVSNLPAAIVVENNKLIPCIHTSKSEAKRS